MRPLTEPEIRASLLNSTDEESRTLSLPIDYLLTEWDHISFLGWRDQKAAKRGYILIEQDGEPVGIVLRVSDASMSRHRNAYCNLCHTLQPADQVAMFTARKAGEAGERGDTVGTYICADLSCQENVLLSTPLAQNEVVATDRAERHLAGLHERTSAFVSRIFED